MDPHEDIAAAPMQRTRHEPLVFVLIAVCLGVSIDRVYAVPLPIWCVIAGGCLIVWVALRRRTAPAVGAGLVLAACLAAAGTWHHWNWDLFDATEIGRYAAAFPRRVALRVEATEPVKFIPAPAYNPLRTIPAHERSRVAVRVQAIRDRSQWRAASGNATLLVDGHVLGVHPGDQLQVFGRIIRPPPANNPGEFDFAAYRRTQGQLCLIRATYPDCVTILQSGNRWELRSWFAELRGSGSALLWSHLDHRRAGLAAAVLLGERDRLEHDRTEAFVETGTIHLLAISGLHVGILVSVLLLIFRLGWVSRRWSLAAVIALTVFYALLTDARPPVLRAAVLVVVMCVALLCNRRQSGFNTLAAAAILVLFWNPANLFRIGTQLSFLAVATLICMGPIWQRWQQQDSDALRWLIASTRPLPVRLFQSAKKWFLRLTLAGFVVWAVAAPLVMYHFHLFSPSGFLLTPVLYIPIALALSAGLGVLLFGWIFPPLADAFGFVCDINLAILEWVVQATRSSSYSFAWVAGPPVWWLAVFYLALALWALLPRVRPSAWRGVGLVAVWGIAGFLVPPLLAPKDELRCTFIAVGHGCSVLVELPDGRAFLYDAGRMGSPETATRAISSTLWSRGRTHLDAVIISHADADHFNALPELLQRFSVGVVYVSPAMRRDESQSVAILYTALQEADVPLRTIKRGDQFGGGGATVDVLHPSAAGVEETHHGSIDNANSIVLALEYQSRRVLLTGDLEAAGLESVISEPPLPSDVVLAPHHGSRHSQPNQFARWCQPRTTIVISGLDELSPRIVAAYGGANRQLLHTGVTGAVQVTIKDDQLHVTRHRKDEPRRNSP